MRVFAILSRVQVHGVVVELRLWLPFAAGTAHKCFIRRTAALIAANDCSDLLQRTTAVQ